jgi:hypothetical protein
MRGPVVDTIERLAERVSTAARRGEHRKTQQKLLLEYRYSGPALACLGLIPHPQRTAPDHTNFMLEWIGSFIS